MNADVRRIAICTPIHRQLDADFVTSLIRTMKAMQGADIVWVHCIGHANLARARNYLVQQARATGASDIVFIDSDIGWEPAAFHGLFDAPPNARIIAGCPQRRTESFGFCGRPDAPEARQLGHLISGEAATAFLRVSASVFDELEPHALRYTYQGKDTPAFFSIPITDGEMLDEDISFSRLCRNNGVDVWLHPGIVLRHWHHLPLTECMADHMSIKEAAHG